MLTRVRENYFSLALMHSSGFRDQTSCSETGIYQQLEQVLINNFLSSYTEVTKLLKGRGIDLDHKRFLILQGEVESISR